MSQQPGVIEAEKKPQVYEFVDKEPDPKKKEEHDKYWASAEGKYWASAEGLKKREEDPNRRYPQYKPFEETIDGKVVALGDSLEFQASQENKFGIVYLFGLLKNSDAYRQLNHGVFSTSFLKLNFEKYFELNLYSHITTLEGFGRRPYGPSVSLIYKDHKYLYSVVRDVYKNYVNQNHMVRKFEMKTLKQVGKSVFIDSININTLFHENCIFLAGETSIKRTNAESGEQIALLKYPEGFTNTVNHPGMMRIFDNKIYVSSIRNPETVWGWVTLVFDLSTNELQTGFGPIHCEFIKDNFMYNIDEAEDGSNIPAAVIKKTHLETKKELRFGIPDVVTYDFGQDVRSPQKLLLHDQLLFGIHEDYISVWCIKREILLAKLEVENSCCLNDVVAVGNRLFIGTGSGGFEVWDLTTYKPIIQHVERENPTGNSGHITDIVIDKGRMFCAQENSVTVWKV